MDDPKKREAFNLPGFIDRNIKEIQFPEILAYARALKSQYPKVGSISFCHRGWAVFKLVAYGPELVDCISTTYPTFLTEDEISAGRMPTQILTPEYNHRLTIKLKAYYNRIIPILGLPYKYIYFPRISHRFTTRANLSNEDQKLLLERAKRLAVN